MTEINKINDIASILELFESYNKKEKLIGIDLKYIDSLKISIENNNSFTIKHKKVLNTNFIFLNWSTKSTVYKNIESNRYFTCVFCFSEGEPIYLAHYNEELQYFNLDVETKTLTALDRDYLFVHNIMNNEFKTNRVN